MAKINAPRKGSLQFWPRKRASKFLPRVNWNVIDSGKNLKGFICYKAGMTSVSVKDNTPNSMTKGKKIVIPATILECPPMKIYSARFYKNCRVKTEVLAENFEKELKRKIKLPKNKGKKIDEIKDFDDLKLICYSLVKKTNIKKTPDLTEIGLSGGLEEKIAFTKENIGKEITLAGIFERGQLIDLRGLTKGKGFQGPVKRFGITLRSHKSEKGVRKVGSIGPWHPTRVTFRVPMAGQLGMFSRVIYNNKIIDIGKAEEAPQGIKNFGNVLGDYILVRGSVQGSVKRVLIATSPMRISKQQKKRDMEFIEFLK